MDTFAAFLFLLAALALYSAACDAADGGKR